MSVLHHQPGPPVRDPGRLARPRAWWLLGAADRRPHPDAALLRRRLAPVRLPLLPRLGAVRHRAVRARGGASEAGSASAGWLLIVFGVVVMAWASTGRTTCDRHELSRPAMTRRSPSSRSSSCPARPGSSTRSSGRASSSSSSATRPRPSRRSSTGFFGGMAIGSVVGGRIADRVRVAAPAVRPARARAGSSSSSTPLTFRLINEALPRHLPVARGLAAARSRSSGSRWRSWPWRRRRS